MNFRFKSVAIAILMTGTCAFAKSDAMETSEKVVVCLQSDRVDYEVGKAEILTSTIFRQANVILEWHGSAHSCRAAGQRAIVVHLRESAPRDVEPHALARAYPFEGVRIDVFLSRIPSFQADPESVVLAHVFAHEITHILQDVARHSETGVMKARWSSDDYAHMRLQPLLFTREDIELIHQGLAARAARPISDPALIAAR